MSRLCELYRHYDANDNLLYVGISQCTPVRLAQHKSCSPWFGDIAKIMIERFPCRADALKAERDAIVGEKPQHNKSGKPNDALDWLYDRIDAGPMAAAQVKASRQSMNMTQEQLANELELSADGKRTVRHWETDGGKFQITGPARVAIRLMLAANSEMRKGRE